MFGKFHNEDYDGIVLHIPNWFIALNGIEPYIEDFKNHLTNCSKSCYHPDHLNNIHELSNYLNKAKIAKEKKEAAARQQESRNNYIEALKAGEVYELEWINERQYLSHECFKIGEQYFEWEDYFTNKMHIKAQFITRVNSLIKTFDDLKSFAIENCSMLRHHMELRSEELLPVDYSFYTTTNASLGISYRHLGIKTNWRNNRNNKLMYTLAQLVIFPDGCYAINAGGNQKDYIRLEGFIKEGMKLVKSK